MCFKKFSKLGTEWNFLNLTKIINQKSFNKYYTKQRNFLFIFRLHWVFTAACGLSLTAESWGYPPAVEHELLIAAASLVAEQTLRHDSSAVAAHGLSCPMACGIFPDQGSNLCPLHWQVDSLPLDHQGNPWFVFFKVEKLKHVSVSERKIWLIERG